MTRYHDITVPLQAGIPYWPGDASPEFEQYAALSRGDIVNATRIRCSAHTGTHVDAPRHIFDEGAGADALDLNTLLGPAAVIHVPEEVRAIDRAVLAAKPWPDVPRILLKTANSRLWRQPRHAFKRDYVSLTADGAEFLLERQVRLVGVDYLSIDLMAAEDLPVHQLLLGAGVIAVEGLDLRAVSPGMYQLICLPLKLVAADGAPARAVLVENRPD